MKTTLTLPFFENSSPIGDFGRALEMEILSWEAWLSRREDDEVEEAADEGAGGSADVYPNMSQGDWKVRQGQWMDQQDRHLGQLDTWMEQ
ncbi:hypothetical protein Tco_1349860 [Tanacetum coccineum]